jgi:hypothetical protein
MEILRSVPGLRALTFSVLPSLYPLSRLSTPSTGTPTPHDIREWTSIEMFVAAFYQAVGKEEHETVVG